MNTTWCEWLVQVGLYWWPRCDVVTVVLGCGDCYYKFKLRLSTNNYLQGHFLKNCVITLNSDKSSMETKVFIEANTA